MNTGCSTYSRPTAAEADCDIMRIPVERDRCLPLAATIPSGRTGWSAVTQCTATIVIGTGLVVMRRLNKRTLAIGSVAALLVLGGGAAFAYWTNTGSGTGQASTGSN